MKKGPSELKATRDGGVGLALTCSNLVVQIGSAMAWTTERPRSPGWYWFRGQAGRETVDLEVIRLDFGGNGQLTPASSFGFQDWADLDRFVGHWEGPLAPSPFDA